jgi:hypothetical protein
MVIVDRKGGQDLDSGEDVRARVMFGASMDRKREKSETIARNGRRL